MITRRISVSWIYPAVLIITLMSGCLAEKSPQEAARNFWDAMKVQDIENARKYSTTNTRSLIDTSNGQFRGANVTFGKILIDDNTTTIETTVRTQKNGTETTIPLQTILKQENGEWRVDYQQTKESMTETSSISDIAKDLQELGKKLSDRMDEALGEIKQKVPEYEEKIKKLGETASKKMDEAWQRQVSEIKKSIEELGKILDEMLKREHDGSKQEKL